MLAMARRTRKKSQFQVELDRLMREVELKDEDCAATATHQPTEGPQWSYKHEMISKINGGK